MAREMAIEGVRQTLLLRALQLIVFIIPSAGFWPGLYMTTASSERFDGGEEYFAIFMHRTTPGKIALWYPQ
jgi:hypothetical protein